MLNATCTGKDLRPYIPGSSAGIDLSCTSRRINTFFACTKHWKTYDCFSIQKTETFKSSCSAVLELAARYRSFLHGLSSGHKETLLHSELATSSTDRLIFEEFVETSLWGNATDLSLLTNLSYSDIQKLQGLEARKSSKEKIIANDMDKAFLALQESLSRAAGEARTVDIVLDNAGFELFTDLILASYLLAANLATKIVFHPKSIPWFVSDALMKDFNEILDSLQDPQRLYANGDQILSAMHVSDLQFLSQEWRQHFVDENFVIQRNRFWTTASSYWELPAADPELFAALQRSELVIFKGDLNYRKLTCDV
jgi:damage-control phosphatase, subfamily III